MFISTEKVGAPRSAQIFNDYVAEDAAQEKRENDNRWQNKILDTIAAMVRSARN